jgi:preprotein translocase subunit SecD
MLRFGRTTVIFMATICLAALIIALPNFFAASWRATHWPSWLPNRTVNLGLDLQGGAHLLIQVELDELRREFLIEKQQNLLNILKEKNLKPLSVKIENTQITLKFEALDAAELANTTIKQNTEESFGTSVQDLIVTVLIPQEDIKLTEDRAVGRALEIIRNRIDATGTKEPVVQRQGRNQIVVQLPGVHDPARVKALLGRTAKLTFHLVNTDIGITDRKTAAVPPNTQLLPFAGGRTYAAVFRRALVNGDELVDAHGSFHENEAVVAFRFNTSGSRKFARATSENVGKPFAIVLDGEVISAPRINEPITSGSGIISGSFTPKSAEDLALLLRSGALPVPLSVVEERTVGPGLGADSIRAGTTASIISLIATVIFMIAVYGLFGGFATLALAMNLVLLLAAMSLFGATLTLPGLAGIVLTIGMAVDANVLIYERIREEVKLGQGVLGALQTGFGRVYSTIVDANVTMLISALMLYIFGTGTIKGFAVTLTLGVITSMFTAVMLTRYIVVVWLHRTKPKELPI